MAGNPLNTTVDTSGRGKSYSPKVSAKKRTSFYGNDAYEGEPDPGIEPVYPEMLLPAGRALGAIGKAAQLGGRLKQAGEAFMESPAVNATKRTVKFSKSTPKSPRPATPKAPKPPRFDLAKKFELTPKQKGAWHERIREAGDEVPAPKPAAKTPKLFVHKTAPKRGPTTHEYHDTFVGPKDQNKITPAERAEDRAEGVERKAQRMGPPRPTVMQRAAQERKDFVGPKRQYQDVSELRQAVSNDEKFQAAMRADKAREAERKVSAPRAPRRSKAEMDAARAANEESFAKSRAAEREAFNKAFPDNASKKLMDTNVLKADKKSAKEIFKDITGTYKKGGTVKAKKKPLPFWMSKFKKGAKSGDKAKPGDKDKAPMKFAKGGMVSRGNGCAKRGFK